MLIGQLQAKGVLPVDAATDGLCGLAIGEALGELQDRDEKPAARGPPPAVPGRGKGRRSVHRRRRCPGHPSWLGRGCVGEGGPDDVGGRFRDRAGGRGLERHVSLRGQWPDSEGNPVGAPGERGRPPTGFA
jgi:hypothetical protein